MVEAKITWISDYLDFPSGLAFVFATSMMKKTIELSISLPFYLTGLNGSFLSNPFSFLIGEVFYGRIRVS